MDTYIHTYIYTHTYTPAVLHTDGDAEPVGSAQPAGGEVTHDASVVHEVVQVRTEAHDAADVAQLRDAQQQVRAKRHAQTCCICIHILSQARCIDATMVATGIVGSFSASDTMGMIGSAACTAFACCQQKQESAISCHTVLAFTFVRVLAWVCDCVCVQGRVRVV